MSHLGRFPNGCEVEDSGRGYSLREITFPELADSD